MNIISGNCAGAFSGFLAHLAWMETAERSNGQINLTLHSRNKTDYPGNSYTGYQWVNSSDIHRYGSVLEENILFEFFQENKYLKKDFPNEYIYFETYPVEFKSNLNFYPEDTLKYDGKGGLKEQYTDIENLTLTRNALNRQWNKFKFTEQFNKLVRQEEKLIKNKKVVCLMLRHSEHYIGATKGYKMGGPNVLSSAIQSIKNIIDNYDAVLLNTLIQPFVDEFKKEFGDKCIFTDRERFSIDIDWKGGRYDHPTMSYEEYKIEYQNAFLDVILASKTNLVIGASSNMFLSSLCMNPQIPFDIFCVADGC